MLAKRCDRCEKYYDIYIPNKDNFNTIKTVTRDVNTRESYITSLDLCEDCATELKTWLNNASEGE